MTVILSVRVIPGISLAELALHLSKREKGSTLALVDGFELSGKHVPPFPPNLPALVTQIASASVVRQVKTVLLSVYPENHPVQWIDPIKRSIELVPLGELQTLDT